MWQIRSFCRPFIRLCLFFAQCNCVSGASLLRTRIRFFICPFLLLLILPIKGLTQNEVSQQVNTNNMANTQTILILGDSLSASYGIDIEDGWVSLLDQRLKQHSFSYSIVNASISGDTTSSGVSRIKDLLTRHQPNIVIIELGANDALRGISLPLIRDNLDTMIKQSIAAGSKVLLAGMKILPNYGPQFADRFESIYPQLADEYDISLIPFFLDGIGGNPSLNLQDGVHPNEKAQPIILELVWQYLQPLLNK